MTLRAVEEKHEALMQEHETYMYVMWCRGDGCLVVMYPHTEREGWCVYVCMDKMGRDVSDRGRVDHRVCMKDPVGVLMKLYYGRRYTRSPFLLFLFAGVWSTWEGGG